MVAGTRLIPVLAGRDLTKAEYVALHRLMRLPVFAGRLEVWRAYCRWATEDAFLDGSRERGFPANLLQATAAQHVDRWAARDRVVRSTRDLGPIIKLPPDTPIGPSSQLPAGVYTGNPELDADSLRVWNAVQAATNEMLAPPAPRAANAVLPP